MSSTINNNNNNNNNKYDDNKSSKEETIELLDKHKSQVQQLDNTTSDFKSDKFRKKMFKTSNLVNEFNDDLDVEYKKSFLAITRIIFIAYIFYLIIYSICWIIYYSIDNSFYLNQLITFENDNITRTTTDTELSNVIIYLYSVYLTILIIIFVFLLMFEFKQMRYKQLKNDIKRRILENRVDKEKAEKNFKEAISHYMENSAKIKLLEEQLDSDHNKSLSKLAELYSRFSQIITIIILIFICAINILAFKYKPNALTFIGHSVWYIEIILIMYCIYPFNIYIKVLFALVFSVIYETFSLNEQFQHFKQETHFVFIFAKILFNMILHSIGFYLYAYLEILKRNTFLNVYNMNLKYITAQHSKTITETMIKSIMPPLFTNIFGKPEEFKKSVSTMFRMRPLYVYPIDNISILFADIVGFTKMSSNKTAEQLVFLLNDLYGRFDRLCEELHCEKISTLGDCYYCVSGCLNCRDDHAKCCVEMGLSMVKEIEAFNKDHGVEVNMRVGVHTGKALCGFIGGKRFRFDVWSSDVTFANKMESTGRAGWVHISQATCNELNNQYNLEKDENKVNGEFTYFVIPDEKRKVKDKTVKEELEQKKKQEQEQQQQLSQQEDSAVKLSIEQTTATATNENIDQNRIEFFRPNMNILTMCFKYKLERTYYQFLMGYNFIKRDQPQNEHDNCKISTKNWSNPRNIFFISLLLSLMVNSFILFSYISVYLTNINTNLHIISLIVAFCLLIVTQLAFILVYLFKYTTFFKSNKKLTSIFSTQSKKDASKATNHHKNSEASTSTNLSSEQKSRNSLIKYAVVHLISILYLVLSPIIIFLFSFILNNNLNNNLFLLYSSLSYIFTIIQFCTFIQLNYLFKSFLMTLYIALYCVFAFTWCHSTSSTFNLNGTNETVFVKAILNDSISMQFLTDADYYKTYFQESITNTNYVLIIDLLLLLVLVFIINRQFELVQRVCFQSDQDTYLKINSSKDEKELANWLIDVVIPAHVVDHVKRKIQYSHNYDCVGVLFVSLCNYAEFYEETFKGGRELIRVLNEISIDFDQLLDDPKYRNIEKIKSIGSTFMIASGLNVDNKNSQNDGEEKNQHLYDLVDFALKLWEILASFNKEAMSVCHFKFHMRMGLNFGSVTAGVIGKDRLLYDIWGDTVNVASRMDSTGQEGVLQTPEAAATFLSNKYLFHYRDKIKVKGKDSMITYVLKPSENLDANHQVGLINEKS